VFLLKIAFVTAPLVIIAAAFLPKILIQRHDRQLDDQAIEEFRSTLPVDETVVITLDPEEVDLDAMWAAYWSNSRAEENALRADLNDWVGWAAALEDRFALECDRIVKEFAVAAITLQAETASVKGGWKSDVDRRADVIIQRVDGSVAKLNHELKVEVAECTATGSWNEETERQLTALLSGEEVNTRG
jgi:hypothetical protein